MGVDQQDVTRLKLSTFALADSGFTKDWTVTDHLLSDLSPDETTLVLAVVIGLFAKLADRDPVAAREVIDEARRMAIGPTT